MLIYTTKLIILINIIIFICHLVGQSDSLSFAISTASPSDRLKPGPCFGRHGFVSLIFNRFARAITLKWEKRSSTKFYQLTGISCKTEGYTFTVGNRMVVGSNLYTEKLTEKRFTGVKCPGNVRTSVRPSEVEHCPNCLYCSSLQREYV